jgi:hypothetical protein
MKRIPIFYFLFIFQIIISNCSSKGKAELIVQEWCELNAAVFKEVDYDKQKVAKKRRNDFAIKIREEYKNDDAFLEDLNNKIKKCKEEQEKKLEK